MQRRPLPSHHALLALCNFVCTARISIKRQKNNCIFKQTQLRVEHCVDSQSKRQFEKNSVACACASRARARGALTHVLMTPS